MARGVIIPARITHKIDVAEFKALEDYQFFVGGLIEPVDLPLLGATMYVNEEGRLRGLEFNPRATFLWWYWEPAARQKAMIVGDVVVVGQPDEDGNSTDLSQELLAIFTQRGEYRIEVQWKEGDDWEMVVAPQPYLDYFDALVWVLILAEKGHVHQIKVVTTLASGEGPIESRVDEK